MREETRKLYDYKLNIPSDMLNKIGISKNEFVGIREVEDGILLVKPAEQKANKTLPESSLPKIKNTIETKEAPTKYKTKVIKRKLFTIPKDIFDKYELAEKNFDTDFELVGDSANTVGIITIADDGLYKFRKDNSLSLAFIFPDLEIEEGKELEIEDANGKILIYFNYQVSVKGLQEELNKQEELFKKYTPPSLSDKVNLEIPNIPVYYKGNTSETASDYNEIFHQKVLKRNTMNIPSDIFKKYEYSLKKYDSNVKDTCLYITFNQKGRSQFPKSNTLNLTSIAKPIELSEGMPITLYVSKNSLKIDFSDNNTDSPSLEEKEELIEETLPEINNIKDSVEPVIETKSEEKRFSKKYYEKLQELKRNKSTYIRFISEKDLPDETNCSKCNKELTDKDTSMVDSHRICNTCKRVELKEWFKPLYELAKLREEK